MSRCAACSLERTEGCVSGWVSVRDERGVAFAERCQHSGVLAEARRLVRAGIPEAYEAATVAGYVDPAGVTKADAARKDIQREVAGWVRDRVVGVGPRGLLLTGPCGTGKTHLACACLRALIVRLRVRGLFLPVREWLERLQGAMDEGARESHHEVMAGPLSAKVLALDELGQRPVSDWNEGLILMLLDGLPSAASLIVTTNLSAAELERAMRPRIASRLLGMSKIVEGFTELPDYRRQ